MSLYIPKMSDTPGVTIPGLAGNFEQIGLQLESKASKQQENWHTATLLLGWTGFIRYRKNDMGYVTIALDVTAGTVNAYDTVAQLPSNYAPYIGTPFVIANPSTGRTVNLYIDSNGRLAIPSGSGIETGANYRGLVYYLAR